jgi:hypothetical protein
MNPRPFPASGAAEAGGRVARGTFDRTYFLFTLMACWLALQTNICTQVNRNWLTDSSGTPSCEQTCLADSVTQPGKRNDRRWRHASSENVQLIR